MRVRYRISLGNLSVRTGRVSDFRVEIDRGLSQWTIEWGIGLYVPVLLMYPITSDQTFDLSTRAVLEGQKGNSCKYGAGWLQLPAADETFTAIIGARALFVCSTCRRLTPGLCFWQGKWINEYGGRFEQRQGRRSGKRRSWDEKEGSAGTNGKAEGGVVVYWRVW